MSNPGEDSLQHLEIKSVRSSELFPLCRHARAICGPSREAGMPTNSGVLNDQFWVDLCHNFGLLLLIIVCITTALLMLCGCQIVLSQMRARRGRERQPRYLRRPMKEPSKRSFTTSL